MLWLVLKLLFVDPFGPIDLVDQHGKPDHGKVMGFLAFVCLFGLEAFLVIQLHHQPSAWEWLILGSLAFGWPAWRALLRSKSISSTETVTRAISETIAARREAGAADGVEPAP